MELIKSCPVLCVDPGPTKSGVVVFDGVNVHERWADIPNDELLDWILTVDPDCHEMAIEGISSYGMAVGASVFETCEWIGRFREAFGFIATWKVYRSDVKMFLCQSMRAKDANIRRRILDIFPATGGGKTPQIGTSKKKGPLYGVTSHAMSALAVGLTHKYGEAQCK